MNGCGCWCFECTNRNAGWHCLGPLCEDGKSGAEIKAMHEARELPPPLEDDRVAMLLGLVPDKRTPKERLWDAVRTNGESLRYHYDDPTLDRLPRA